MPETNHLDSRELAVLICAIVNEHQALRFPDNHIVEAGWHLRHVSRVSEDLWPLLIAATDHVSLVWGGAEDDLIARGDRIFRGPVLILLATAILHGERLRTKLQKL